VTKDDSGNHGQPSAAPETIEGWYVLHDLWTVDWPAWRRLDQAERWKLADQLGDWLVSLSETEGDSACYRVIGQKADLMLLHYAVNPAELADTEQALRRLGIFAYLTPSSSFLSVIEASLYEATAIAHGMLARRGLTPGTDGFDAAFADELGKQREALHERVFRDIPHQRFCCFYPMSKRRGERWNWYDMPLEERRDLMRGHGRIGRKYHGKVTQVISGAVGLDDWEWGVDLFGEDPLQFKKLIYEMRFDPATSRFAEFGTFYLGLRSNPEALRELLVA